MVFAPACAHAPGVGSSGGGEPKVGSASRRNERFVPLRRRDDFQRVFRSGRRRASVGLTVLTAEGPSRVPRVGIVAGKRIGNAVKRNRAKRRLREAAARADLRPSSDYILIAGPECNEIALEDLIRVISGKDTR